MNKEISDIMLEDLLSTKTREVKSFTPRLVAPTTTNKYYYSNMNLFYAAGLGMPNCTAYAYGRAYELLNTKPNVSTRHAKYWYDYNKENKIYSYGQTPKLGAIACWGAYGNYTYGHVAVVEKITPTTITISESQYTSKVVFTTHTFNKGDYTYSWNKNFLGFIYISDFGDMTPGEDIPETETTIATGVTTSNLNLREGASTSAAIITTIPKDSKVEILEKLTGWYKVKYDKKVGYASSQYIKLDPVSNGGNTSSTNPLTYLPPTRTLEYTSPIMTGEDVKYVQASLKKLGYNIAVDGSFGPGAKATVTSFQKDNNLTANGQVDSNTLLKLREKIGDPYIYPIPQRAIQYTSPVTKGEDVKFVQAGLKYLGYSISVDGSYGPGTRDVVIKFQKDNGLNAEGYFGSMSLNKLKELLNK